MSTKEYAEDVFGYIASIQAIQKPREFDWKLKQTIASFSQMYDRFCPYTPGDKVVLTKTPDILPTSGWYGSRHFLIAGATATVESSDFRDGFFFFGLVFESETWIDTKGATQPVDRPSIYFFSEKWLGPLAPRQHPSQLGHRHVIERRQHRAQGRSCYRVNAQDQVQPSPERGGDCDMDHPV